MLSGAFHILCSRFEPRGVAEARVKEPSRFQRKGTFDIKVLGLAKNHTGLLLSLCGEGSLRLVLPIFNFWHVKVS